MIRSNLRSKKSSLDEQINIDEEDVAFTKLTELARDANKDTWESKIDKYMNDGLTEEEATLNANQKLNGVDFDQSMYRYGTLIQYMLKLRNENYILK